MTSLIEHFPEDNGLQAYLRQLADMMGLRDWVIRLDMGALEEGTMGQCFIPYGRKLADIKLAEHDTIEELRETMVHELVHCHLDGIRFPISNIRNVIGQSLYDVASESTRDYVEQATQGIAREWAKTLPLPIKGATKRKAKAT